MEFYLCLWSSIFVYGILSLSMEFYLCLWGPIFGVEMFRSKIDDYVRITLPEHPTCEQILEVQIFVVWYITFRQALGKLRSAKSRINYSQPELGKLRSGQC